VLESRSAAASRFLRLAFRVNMENLKLIELDPLPDLEGLPFDDGAGDDESGRTVDVTGQRGHTRGPAVQHGVHRW